MHHFKAFDMNNLQYEMVPFSSIQSRFLEASLVRQADGKLKNYLQSKSWIPKFLFYTFFFQGNGQVFEACVNNLNPTQKQALSNVLSGAVAPVSNKAG